MLRAFLLVFLITRENFAFTTKRIFHTSTSPSVHQRKFGKVSNSAHTNVNRSVDVRYFVRNETVTIDKKTNGDVKRKGIRKQGKNATIRSIIPFTEATFAVQFNDENTDSRNLLDTGYLKELKNFIYSPITVNTVPPADFKQKEEGKKLSTMRTWPYIYQHSSIYRTVKELSDNNSDKDVHNTDVVPLDKQVPGSSNHHSQLAPRYANDADNPIFGDQAFFSFILNDYFDRSVDEDPTISKDLHWGKEFDNVLTPKRIRRLKGDYETSKEGEQSTLAVNYDAKFAKEKLYERMNDSRAIQYGNRLKNSKGFKGFIEIFAQKFGTNDINDELRPQSNKEDVNGLKVTPVKAKSELRSSEELLNELIAIYNDDTITEKDTLMSTVSDFEEFLHNYDTSSVSSATGNSTAHNANDLSRLRYLAKRDALFNNADYIDTSEYAV